MKGCSVSGSSLKSAIRGALVVAVFLTSGFLAADEVTDWEMDNYFPGNTVASGSDTILGEKIDLRTGTLHYNQQDLAIPGNGGMAITVSRSFGGEHRMGSLVPEVLGNWSLDVPRIVGNRTYTTAGTDSFCRNPYPGVVTNTKSILTTYAFIKYSANGRLLNGDVNWINKGPGQESVLTNGDNGTINRAWVGLALHVPGEKPRALLFRDGLVSSTSGIPNIGAIAGVQYVTSDNWQVTCIDVAGRSGAGFEVKSPDGRVYKFTKDYFPRNPNRAYDYANTAVTVGVDNTKGFVVDPYDSSEARLYENKHEVKITTKVTSGADADHFAPVHWVATEVTDKNGNKIYYDYDASPDSMGKLNLAKIRGVDSTGADAREVTLTYYGDVAGAGKLLDKASGEGRTVSYTYTNNQLRQVTRADESWKFCYYGASGCAGSGSGNNLGSELEWVQTPHGGKVSYLYRKIVARDYLFGYGYMVVLSSRTLTDSTVTPAVTGVWTYDLSTPFLASPVPGGAAGSSEYRTKMVIKSPKHPAQEGYMLSHYQGAAFYPTQSRVSDEYEFAATKDWKHGLLRVAKDGFGPIYYDWRHVRVGQALQPEQPGMDYLVSPLTEEHVNTPGSTTKYVRTMGYTSGEPYGLPDSVKHEGFVSGVSTGSRIVELKYDNKTSNGKWIIGLVSKETYSGLEGNKSIVRKYDGNGNLESEARFAAYDTAGNLVVGTGSVTSYKYWPTGDIHTVTNPLNFVAKYENYKRGTAETVTDFESNSMTRVVNSDGTIKSEKDFRLNETKYTYDAIGRVTLTTYPEGDSKVNVWSANLTKAGWDGGSGILQNERVETQLDGFGRVTSVAEVASGVQKRVLEKRKYDAMGRVVYEAKPYSVALNEIEQGHNYTYGVSGQVSRITETGNGAITEIQQTALNKLAISYPRRSVNEEYDYDIGTWNPAADQSGIEIDLTFPPTRRVLKRQTYGSDKIYDLESQRVTRDGLGRITSVTARDGVTAKELSRSFKYDANQALWQVTNPETGVTEFGHDAAGNLTSRKVGSSGTTSFKYYPSNRLKAVEYPGNKLNSTFGYDKNGNLESVARGGSTWTYSYDDNNVMRSETLDLGVERFSFSYAYDNRRSLSTMTYPSGTVLKYEPNAWGAPTAMTPYVSSVTRWGNNSWNEMSMANGRKLTGKLNVQKLPHTMVADGSAMSLTYSYDLARNVTGITRSPDSAYDISAAQEPGYIKGDNNYDYLGRLSRVNSKWGGSTSKVDSFTYDGFSNVTSQVINGQARTFSYDYTLNRLTSAAPSGRYSSIQYDVYGNIKHDGSFEYIYDDAGNLVTVGPPVNLKSTEFLYDGNNRMYKRVSNSLETFVVYGRRGKRLIEYRPGAPTSFSDDKLTEFYYLDNQLVSSREVTALDALDSDTDGMSDAYELKYGLYPGVKFYGGASGFDDRDGDNVSDLTEFEKGMNAANRDSDSDGVFDGDELLLGLNPLKGDTDDDGVSDSVELAQGRNPKVNEAALMSIINSLLLN